jgi:hypothetical protein
MLYRVKKSFYAYNHKPVQSFCAHAIFKNAYSWLPMGKSKNREKQLKNMIYIIHFNV